MSKPTKDVKFPIKITNFINPHLFHFKLDHCEFDTDELVARHAIEVKSAYPDGCQPKEDDMVLAYIGAWDKWVRAEIDMVLEEGLTTAYVIWCSDYG